MTYILGWLLNFCLLWAAAKEPRHAKAYCAISVVALGLIAVLRGQTGTDTAAYETISSIVRTGNLHAWGAEPVFNLILRLLQLAGLDDVLTVRGLSVVEVLLLVVYAVRSTQDQRYFLLALFMPAFFYQYTMNTLRIGLASIIFLLSVQSFTRSGRANASAIGIGVTALSFHYTAVFLPAFLASTLRKWSSRSILVVVGLFALGVITVLLISPGYIHQRLANYSNFEVTSALSGISNLVLIFLTLLALHASALPAAPKKRIAIASIALGITFIGITHVTYAGLRLLELLDFALPVALLATHEIAGVHFNVTTKKYLLVAGVAATLFIFRHYVNEPTTVPSPFLPYRLL